jgi:acyl carrier protein
VTRTPSNETPLPSNIRTKLLSLVSEVARPLDEAQPDDEPLGLVSLDVVILHERIEDDLGIRIPASEVTPEAFDTLGALVALVARHGGGAAT